MADDDAARYRTRLAEKLAEGLSAPLPDATRRRVHGAVHLKGKATAVIGMRRAGKTTFLHQIRRERMAHGVPRHRLPYVNFEDEQLAGLGAEHLGFLLEEYYRRFPETRGRETVTWCLDEIQTVPGWERFVRRVLDEEKVEVFVSGSSAALLSREVATAMRGRAWEVVIHPFSFEEYLRHHALPVPKRPSFLPARERSALERAFLDYLTVGGFPEAQGLAAATRVRLLADYVDVAMLRDVVERHDVTNVAGLRWLVRHLLGNAGGMFSVEKFHAALRSQGLSIARDTVHQLLAHLGDCFLVRTVWLDSRSERRRMVNPRKAYPVDPGLMRIYQRDEEADIGHALETAVLVAAGQAYPKARKRLLTLTRDRLPASAPGFAPAPPRLPVRSFYLLAFFAFLASRFSISVLPAFFFVSFLVSRSLLMAFLRSFSVCEPRNNIDAHRVGRRRWRRRSSRAAATPRGTPTSTDPRLAGPAGRHMMAPP